MFIQQLLNGLTMGSIYALLAVGVSMIYKAMGMINFAHGDTIMLSAFFCLTIYSAGLPLWAAILIAPFISAALGLCLERFVYRKLEYGSFSNLLIATVGVSFIMKNSAVGIWGAQKHNFPALFSMKPIHIGSFTILPQCIGMLAIAAFFVGVLQLFFYKTKIGKCMRAAASNAEGATMMGINVSFTRFLTFGISAAFAAVAGILMSPIFYVSTTMATNVATKGFAAAILGGFGSITGGFVGGLILGIIEAIGGAYIATAYKDVISFVVLILVLYFCPNGLLGKKTEQKM